MTLEPNNTIANATDSGVSSQGVRNGTISSDIETNSDVDLFQFQLDQGDGITLDIDASEFGSGLDPILRLFDENGNELAVNDDSFGLDSFIGYVANQTGNYFVGVSSFANFSYDPITGVVSNAEGSSTGNYDLKFNISDITPDDDPDNTIAEAINTGVSSDGVRSTIVNDSIDSGVDVDIYQFQLAQGDTVTLDINASQFGSSLDPILKLFDANGNELAVNDDSSGLDSFITFTANSTGDYFVGVSGFSNFDYDQINGRTNFEDSGQFNSTGTYELIVSVFNTITGTNNNDNLTGTGQNDLIVGNGGNDFIQGNNGNDNIQGGNGFDVIFGGAGDDVLNGNNGIDSLYGNGGSDTFVLESGNDSVFDFQDGVDKIALASGFSFFDVNVENSSAGVGATISLFGQTVGTIVGVDASSITEADFV